MSKISFFCRKNAQRKDGRFPVYASVYTSGFRTRIGINVFIDKNDWDHKAQCVKGRTKYASDINLIIHNAHAKLTDILVRARLQNEKLTREKIISRYHQLDCGVIEEEKSEKFVDFANRYLSEIDKSITYGTFIRRKGIINKIAQYAPDITVTDITPEWLRRYAAHCRDIHANNDGTIKKNLDTIHLFLKVAIRRRLIDDDPFDHYKPPVHYPDITFLTEEELRELATLRASAELKETESIVLDIFLFMSFTGMHYSDASALLISDIKNGEINYRRCKTGTVVKVPVSKPAESLLAKYIGRRKHGKVFQDFPTNQCINRIIKTLAEKAGLTKTLTAKTARHTFATIYYRRNKGDVGTLSRLLGHTSVKNTMVYTHIMKEDRVKGVAVFDDIL